MINIRPVSDLRNKYPEIEEEVLTTGSPVFLTKNGYGSMVVMSLAQYSAPTWLKARQCAGWSSRVRVNTV